MGGKKERKQCNFLYSIVARKIKDGARSAKGVIFLIADMININKRIDKSNCGDFVVKWEMKRLNSKKGSNLKLKMEWLEQI